MKKIKLFAILLLSVLAFQVQAQSTSETILVEYKKATPTDMDSYEFPVIPFAHDTKVAVWGGGGRGARTTKNWTECYAGGGGGGGFARYLSYAGEGWPVSKYKSYVVVGEGGGVINAYNWPDGGTTWFGNQYFGKIKAYGGLCGPQDSNVGGKPGQGDWENGNDVSGYTLGSVLAKGGDVLRKYTGGQGGTGNNKTNKSGNGGTSAGLLSSSSYNPLSPFHSNYVTVAGQNGGAYVSKNQYGGANHPFIGNGGQGSGDPGSFYDPGNGDQPGGGGGASAHDHGLVSSMHANGANGWAFVEFTYDMPTAPTISSTVPAALCIGAAQTLTLTIEDGEYWKSLQWYKNGVAIGGATSASYTIPAGQSGNYQLKALRRALTFDFPGATSVSFTNNPSVTELPNFQITAKLQDYHNNGKIFRLYTYSLTAKEVAGECSSRIITVTSASNVTPVSHPAGYVVDPTFQTKIEGLSVKGDTAYVSTHARSLNLATLFSNSSGLTMYYWKDEAPAFSSQQNIVSIGDYIELYHVGASYSTSCYSEVRHVVITPIRSLVSIWAPGIGGGSGDALRQWNNPNNWLEGMVPSANSTVYIPGYFAKFTESPLGITITTFPELSANVSCRNIYFAFGAEIKGLQYLTADSAYVQLNLGLQSVIQREISSITNVVTEEEKYDHLALSYSLTRKQNTFLRDRWYMLSSPLQEVYSGDYAFGGVPASFMRKFKSGSSTSTSALLGNWSDFLVATNEPLVPGEGFAYYVNHSYLDQLSYREDETLFTIKDPSVRKRPVGLAHVNGILELPYFDATTNLAAEAQEKAHRAHEYVPATRTSYFYDYLADDLGLIFGSPKSAVRTASKSYKLNKSNISYTVNKASGTDNKRFVMIGNPYMSTIDFTKFWDDNSASIQKGYYLYTTNYNPVEMKEVGMFAGFNNTANYTGPVVETTMQLNQYIAPMQSFIVELSATASDPVTLNFNIANISANRTALLNRLRSDESEPNKLIVTAANEAGSVMVSIIRSDEGSSLLNELDFTKLMTDIQELPEIYTLKQEADKAQRIGLANNFIGNEGTLIPIGVATNQAGKLSLMVDGMDMFNGDVQFIDMDSEMEIDITGRKHFEHTVEYTPLKQGLMNEIIASENRFYLRISNAPTAIDDILTGSGVQYHSDAINLYFNSYDKMQSVNIYDIQGRLIYQRSGLNTIMWNVNKALIPTVAVAQVMTDNGSYTFKLINK